MENTLWYQVDRVHNVDQVTLDGLVQVLIDCVQGGASVSFMLPLDEQRALGFWRDVSVGVHSGKRVRKTSRTAPISPSSWCTEEDGDEASPWP